MRVSVSLQSRRLDEPGQGGGDAAGAERGKFDLEQQRRIVEAKLGFELGVQSPEPADRLTHPQSQRDKEVDAALDELLKGHRKRSVLGAFLTASR